MLTPEVIASLANDPVALHAAIAADAAANNTAVATTSPPGTQIAAVNLDQLPAHLQQAAGDDTSASDMGSATDRNRISIKGKVFTMTGSDGKDNIFPMGQELQVIILATDPKGKYTAKAFYPGAFSEGGENIPTCFSSDGRTPDAGCDDPQNDICIGCKHNAFGTGIDQQGQATGGKRCSDSKKLFVVSFDDPAGDIYEMSIPPTSLRYTAAKKYPGTEYQSLGVLGNQLTTHNLPAYAVKVGINFIAGEASPVLTFRVTGYLNEQEFATIKARLDSGEIEGILPSNNKQPAEFTAAPTADSAGAVAGAAAGVAAPDSPTPAPDTPPAQQMPPCPLGAPPGHYMLPAAGGATYQAHIDSNWTDELLIKEGKMS